MCRTPLNLQDEAVKLYAILEGDSFTFPTLQEKGELLIRSVTGRKTISWRQVVAKMVDVQLLSPQVDSTGVVEYFWNIDLARESEAFRQQRQQELQKLESETPRYLLDFAVKLFVQFGERASFSYLDMKRISQFEEIFGVSCVSSRAYLKHLEKLGILEVQSRIRGAGHLNQYGWNDLAIELLWEKKRQYLINKLTTNSQLTIDGDEEHQAFMWLGQTQLSGENNDRVVEFNVPMEDEDQRHDFLERLVKVGVLHFIANGARGGIYRLDRQAYEREVERLKMNVQSESANPVDNLVAKVQVFESLAQAMADEKLALEELDKQMILLRQCHKKVEEVRARRVELESRARSL